jgi:sulfide:quinone oxidoreductase
MTDRLRRPDGAVPRVLVAGGGVAALEAVLALRAEAGMRVELELIAPHDELRYPPLEVVEPFGLVPPRVELGEALAELAARHRRDAVADVDTREHLVRTREGAILRYEALVLAVGARPLPPPEGMLVWGDASTRAAFASLLAAAERGELEHLLFAVPDGVRWSLPLYELAVMTARRLASAGVHVRIALVTPEHAPLAIFGSRPSGRLLEYLESLGIVFVSGTHVKRVATGEAVLAGDERRLPADRVVTIPALRGPALPGVPHDAQEFIPVDPHGAVRGVPDVYAAGDATDHEIKHGGLATQQADAVAEAIAARCGAPVTPAPFRPVLRGMLLTGEQPQYLEANIGEARRDPAGASTPLWWPPAKVAGRHLAPFLAARLGGAPPADPTPPAAWAAGAVPCELVGSARGSTSGAR